MQSEPKILYWRRTDVTGLERLTLSISDDAVSAESIVICLEHGGFRLDHRWRLTPDWRALSLNVERWGRAGHSRMILERADGGWSVDGERRPDLDGAEEPDLSVTPSVTPSRSAGRPKDRRQALRSTRASWTGWR